MRIPRLTNESYNPLAPPCLKDSSQAGFAKGECNAGKPVQKVFFREGENKRGVKIMACFAGIWIPRWVLVVSKYH
jgi:hypothetical protein